MKIIESKDSSQTLLTRRQAVEYLVFIEMNLVEG
jgi:hypothetical protein